VNVKPWIKYTFFNGLGLPQKLFFIEKNSIFVL